MFLLAVMVLLASCTVVALGFAGRPDALSSVTALATLALLPAVVAPRQRRTAGMIALVFGLAWLLILAVSR